MAVAQEATELASSHSQLKHTSTQLLSKATESWMNSFWHQERPNWGLWSHKTSLGAAGTLQGQRGWWTPLFWSSLLRYGHMGSVLGLWHACKVTAVCSQFYFLESLASNGIIQHHHIHQASPQRTSPAWWASAPDALGTCSVPTVSPNHLAHSAYTESVSI